MPLLVLTGNLINCIKWIHHSIWLYWTCLMVCCSGLMLRKKWDHSSLFPCFISPPVSYWFNQLWLCVWPSAAMKFAPWPITLGLYWCTLAVVDAQGTLLPACVTPWPSYPQKGWVMWVISQSDSVYACSSIFQEPRLILHRWICCVIWWRKSLTSAMALSGLSFVIPYTEHLLSIKEQPWKEWTDVRWEPCFRGSAQRLICVLRWELQRDRQNKRSKARHWQANRGF